MKNFRREQELLLGRLRSKIKDLIVRWNEERGVASMIEGRLLPLKGIRDPKEVLDAVLGEYGSLLGPPNISANCKLTGMKKTSGMGYRVKAHQIYDDLPVYGATLLIFGDRRRGVYRVQSSFWREVRVTAPVQMKEQDLTNLLLERLNSDEKAATFIKTWEKTEKQDTWSAEHFPLSSPPTLYLYPVEGGFHPAYDLTAYQPLTWTGIDGRLRRGIGQVMMMLDASTGQVLWEESTREGVSYTDQNGDGSSTLQDSSNNYLTRPLHVVRQGSGNFLMLNRLTTPYIRTCDMGGADSNLTTKVKSDSNLSQDADGHWNTTTTSTTTANRIGSQQPEVDCHFYAEEAWNFYNGLGWNGFDNGNWGTHCPVYVVAHAGMGANAWFSNWSEWDSNLNAKKWFGYIAFLDGQASGTDLKFDFFAGDPIVFGHEYQHAITFFAVQKSAGDPGYLYGNEWLGAIREGLSDAFACLRRGKWINPLFWRDGIIRSGANFSVLDCDGNTVIANCQPFRRIEYPRSTNTYWGDWYCDHYDDVTTTLTTPCFTRKYFASTLISHLAYLVGQGGIHQRMTRKAQLIPVKGVGLQRAAEIFFYALTNKFDIIPTNQQESTLIDTGELLLAAAEKIGGGKRSCEYVMMRRALYALGLYPFNESHVKQIYGGEVTMLPWTIAWQYSRPYLGMPAIWYGSPDLFINNNGLANYEAKVGQENKVFAKVRNIGDQPVSNIKVRFYFCRHGTNLPSSLTNWEKCKDSAGNICELDISTLAAGDTNITDPNNPPAGQVVNWFLDSSFVTSDVDHFCLRAVIESSAPNNDNDCPNEVQSNVQHVQAESGDSAHITFEATNWLDKSVPLDIRVEHTLPRGFRVRYEGKTPMSKVKLNYRQTVVVRYRFHVPTNLAKWLLPPFDGLLVGKVEGEVEGNFRGELSCVQLTLHSLTAPLRRKTLLIEGMVAGTISKAGNLCGHFTGRLDRSSGIVTGEILGDVSPRKGGFKPAVKLNLKGCLEPSRTINFTQYIDGKPTGGITVQVAIKPPIRRCDPEKWL